MAYINNTIYYLIRTFKSSIAAIKGSINKRHYARALHKFKNNISRQLGCLSKPNRGKGKGKALVVLNLEDWSSTKLDTKEENQQKLL